MTIGQNPTLGGAYWRPHPYYNYKAEWIRVVDGDTVILKIDVGFRMTTQQRIRLIGIDTPEMNTPEGPPAREHLIRLLEGIEELLVATQKADSFGRWLGRLMHFDTNTRRWVDINQQMIDDGHAVPYRRKK